MFNQSLQQVNVPSKLSLTHVKPPEHLSYSVRVAPDLFVSVHIYGSEVICNVSSFLQYGQVSCAAITAAASLALTVVSELPSVNFNSEGNSQLSQPGHNSESCSKQHLPSFHVSRRHQDDHTT